MAKNSTLSAPGEMSPAEKKAFARLVKTLRAQGINPASRAHLIEDFVFSESSLTALRKEYQESNGGLKLATSRAINVATAERRRIHAALFAAVKNFSAEPGRNEADRNEGRQQHYTHPPDTEAIRAWVAYLQDQNKRPKQKNKMIDVGRFVQKVMRGDARSRQLEKKFGPIPFAALLHPSLSDPE